MSLHPVHPADLSAYHDGELRGAALRRVEEHLAACEECRGILAQYNLMGDALRAETAEGVPAAVDHRVRALARAQSRAARRPALSGFGAFRPALAGVAIAAVLLAVVMVGLPFGGDSTGSRVASAYLSSEDGRPTIEVHFTGPVDHGTVQESVRLDPPVEVSVSWRGDTMVVKPREPLQKSKYVLSLKAEGSSGSPAPVAFDLPPAPVSTPMSLPTKPPAAVVAQPSSTTTPTTSPTTNPTTNPTASPTAAATPGAATPTAQAATATPAPVYPVVRGFGALLRAQPAIASYLGAAREAEHGVEAVVQPLQRGLMVWRADRKEIYAIVEGWGWRPFRDTFDGTGPAARAGEPARGFGKVWREQADVRAAIGSTTGAEAGATVVVQEFEHGLLLWTADRKIYVLFESGAWDRYADAFQDATATPTPAATSSPTPPPTATATPVPSATPTATAPRATSTATPTGTPTVAPSPTSGKTVTPTPTTTQATPQPTATRATPGPTATRATPEPTVTPSATPTPPVECAVAPARGFGLVYGSSPALAALLGCAQAEETRVQVVRQTFESGLMLWRSDTGEIVVIRRDGGWSAHRDSWREGELLVDAGTPPAGLVAPVRGFGKLWRQPEIRQSLGWATSGEQQLVGAVQEFASGEMLWTADKLIYVLLETGAWQSFADSYSEPTPSPRRQD